MYHQQEQQFMNVNEIYEPSDNPHSHVSLSRDEAENSELNRRIELRTDRFGSKESLDL